MNQLFDFENKQFMLFDFDRTVNGTVEVKWTGEHKILEIEIVPIDKCATNHFLPSNPFSKKYRLFESDLNSIANVISKTIDDFIENERKMKFQQFTNLMAMSNNAILQLMRHESILSLLQTLRCQQLNELLARIKVERENNGELGNENGNDGKIEYDNDEMNAALALITMKNKK